MFPCLAERVTIHTTYSLLKQFCAEEIMSRIDHVQRRVYQPLAEYLWIAIANESPGVHFPEI